MHQIDQLAALLRRDALRRVEPDQADRAVLGQDLADLRLDVLLDVPVEQVMTRTPKTLRGNQLASEALELFNSTKITAAIVVDGGKPVGIVHLHDLLRAGLA